MKLSRSHRIALVILSGAAYALLLPPFAWSPLAWVALVPLLIVLASESPTRAAAHGLLWAATATIGVAWWFPAMLERYFELPSALAWLGLLGLGVVVDGLPYAAFGVFVGWGTRRGVVNPITLAAAWGLAEWLRANGSVANPFAQLAYSQTGTPFDQAADLAGPYGLGMLIVAVNAAVAGLCLDTLGGPRPRRRLAWVGVVLLGTFVYGHARLQQDFGHGEAVRVALVQGAIARELDWDRSLRDQRLDRYLELTRQAASREPAVVFWPEFAVDFYVQEATLQRARLLDGVRTFGADLVLGGSHYRRTSADGAETETEYFNSVYVVDSVGRLHTNRYDKRRLVPFAEYGPFGELLRAKTAVYTPGREPTLLLSGGVLLGAFICGEALYPEISRELAIAGAELLANPSNDYWFGHPHARAQQLQAASFRAIENRRYLVRPTSTGVSAVIDPHGRAVIRSRGEGPEVLHAELRPSSAVTPYHRIGERPIAAAAAWMTGAIGLGLRRGPSHPAHREART